MSESNQDVSNLALDTDTDQDEIKKLREQNAQFTRGIIELNHQKTQLIQHIEALRAMYDQLVVQYNALRGSLLLKNNETIRVIDTES